MIRKCLAIEIILLFLGACFIPAIAQDTEKQLLSRGNWLYVGGSGPGNYTRIQDAINDANTGDTIFVFRGVYNESFSIQKSITVLGEDKTSTIIDGQFLYRGIVQLVAENILFSGFKIVNSKQDTDDGFGISVSSHDIVTNNIIADNGFFGGIIITGDYNQINNNIIHNNQGHGIYIRKSASYSTISENNIYDNNDGIMAYYCDNSVISNNHIQTNKRRGLWIYGTENNEYSYNLVEYNIGPAFYFEEKASGDRIKGNIIKNNGEGLVINDAQSLIITENFFYAQGIQLVHNEVNYWITHTISNNSINEKPIYFLKNEEEVVVPSDAGQVILASCSNCIIENINTSNIDYGIQLGFSWRNTISNNKINHATVDAIKLKDSQENEIFNNRIFDCNNGIFVVSSNYTSIHENSIENNSRYGIYIQSSFNNIYSNNFENNYAGLYLDFSHFNTISQNNFIKNSKFQVSYMVNYLFPKSNIFKQNYYDDAGFFIRIISGKVRMQHTSTDKLGDIVYYYRPGFMIDWHPAQKPYNISVIS
jgi:parallel beta-helix repeat protein